MRWLFKARKRYGLCITSYMAISSHIHLQVFDRAEREIISRAMQLVAGRTG
jgi:putative transposase